jgi:hypothetical protein
MLGKRSPRGAPDRVKFETHFVKKSRHECWIWTSRIGTSGYGRFTMGYAKSGRQTNAHRAAYAIYVGPVPDHLLVCHKCDVRACVNPSHLFLGTPLDNMKDMIRKGRGKLVQPHYGERNGLAKLDANKVRAIRRSEETDAALARKYGVSHPALASARRGETWRHVH